MLWQCISGICSNIIFARVIFLYACFGIVFIGQAANEYPGDPAYCEQLVQQVSAGKNIHAIQEEQLQRLNHPQLKHLAWHVEAYQNACAMIIMSRNRPDLWNQIERVCAELKTVPSQQKCHPKEYKTPEREAYDYIFERISKLNHLKKRISQELEELGAPAEPEPWQFLDDELFLHIKIKKIWLLLLIGLMMHH